MPGVARQVDALMAALGTDGFRDALRSVERLGPAACDRILALVAGEVDVPVGIGATNGRAVAEDLSDVVSAAARTWPDRFTHLVARSERLMDSVSVLWALRFADSPAGTAILLRAVGRRQAGHRYARWAALESLVDLRSPAVPDVLGAALADRASAVRYTAAAAAVEFGDRRHLEALHRIAARETEAAGTRRAARAAVDAIGRRRD